MFRRLADFQKSWSYESDATLKVLKALTDASLSQAVTPQGRTLGRLAWHITGSIPEMMNRTGLRVSGLVEGAPVPTSAAAIASAYEETSRSLVDELAARWTDASLDEKDEMYGETWKRGFTLAALLHHQVHHRGQMTVLMRQAGLKPPGIYGPAREDWSTMGVEAPTI
jgi:uncharacterized damage-inducible protein DinB